MAFWFSYDIQHTIWIMQPNTTRSRKKQATRERLLEAAARQLKVDGLSRTSIEGVMSAAGLTRGSFYAYFKDKDDLVLEALRWAVHHAHKRVEAQLPDHLSPDGRLKAFLGSYLS
jgi:AcrR family transcriptional regulator